MSREAELAALSFVWAKVLAAGETMVDAPPGPISIMLDRVHRAFVGDNHALEVLERARRDGTQDSVDALAGQLVRYAERDRKLADYMLDFRVLLDQGNESQYTAPGIQDVKTARDAFADGGRRPGREPAVRRNTGASGAPGAEPGGRPLIHYREDRASAKRPSVAIAELLGTGLCVGLLVAGKVFDDGKFFFRFLIAFWIMSLIRFLALDSGFDGAGYTGIQVTPEGVAIGGIRFAERRSLKARRRRAVVPLQHSQVFFCPWNGIREIYVEEDRRRLRKAARRAGYGRGPTELGNLSVGWMRAALVMQVDLSVAALPEIRRTGYSIWSEIWFDEEPSPIWHGIWFARQTGRGFHQELWTAPTRRPAELRQVLAEAAEAGLLRQDPQ